MLKKIPYSSCLNAIVEALKKEGVLPVYIERPTQETEALIWLELLGKREEDSDTLLADVITILIHIVAPIKNQEEQFKKIEAIEKILGSPIVVEEPYKVLSQKEVSLSQIPSIGEHTVLVTEFKIAYGYKVKN